MAQSLVYFGTAALVVVASFLVSRVIVRLDYRRYGHLTLLSGLSQWGLAFTWVIWTHSFMRADWPRVRVPAAVPSWIDGDPLSAIENLLDENRTLVARELLLRLLRERRLCVRRRLCERRIPGQRGKAYE